MLAPIDLPNDADAKAFLDLSFLPEAQRVAFYGSMFAVAAADGIWGQDELDLIFQNINTDGLSEHSRNTVWEYLVEAPPLTDCLTCFSTDHDRVRCAVMLYMIEIALADRVLPPDEEEALLQARMSLRISQKQIEAIERYICEVGLIRARPRDYHDAATSWKSTYGTWLLAGVSLSAIALYLSSAGDRVTLPTLLARFARPGSGLTIVLATGVTTVIGAAAVLTARWLFARYRGSRLPIAHERRRRAQAAVRNLEEAIGYLTAKAKLSAAIAHPSEPSKAISATLMERITVLRQMLARRQPGPAAG
jgi:uncharacterized tellurite resistance protein B-like protein